MVTHHHPTLAEEHPQSHRWPRPWRTGRSRFAQRILRERKEKNLKTRFMVDDAKKHKETKAKSETMPLHLALRQSASKNGNRAQAARRLKEEVRRESAGKSSMPMRQVPSPDKKPSKSILKKSNSHSSNPGKSKHKDANHNSKQSKHRKSNGHVNFAYDHETRSSENRNVNVMIHWWNYKQFQNSRPVIPRNILKQSLTSTSHTFAKLQCISS